MNGLSYLIVIFILSGTLSANEWRARWISEMNQIESLSIPSQIDRLGIATRSKSTKGGWNPTEDQLAVANRAVELLLAIPGHAEFYRDRILKAQEDLRNVSHDPNLAGPKGGVYRNEQMYGFGTLEQLPSVENVRVLGELLANDWVPPGNDEFTVSERHGPLSLRASSTLLKLPIKNKPYQVIGRLSNDMVIEALPAWRDWHEQIKAGNRTFSFEGDSTEYDLNGPAPKEKLVRIERDQKRDLERAGGVKKTVNTAADKPATDAVEQSTAFIGAVIAFFLCGLAAWTLIRGKRIR